MIRVLTRSFVVFSAHDVALSKQHKSISASDVLKALEMLEFTDMVEQLQGELQGSYSFFDLLPCLMCLHINSIPPISQNRREEIGEEKVFYSGNWASTV